jgi:hypothetical protein
MDVRGHSQRVAAHTIPMFVEDPGETVGVTREHTCPARVVGVQTHDLCCPNPTQRYAISARGDLLTVVDMTGRPLRGTPGQSGLSQTEAVG